LAKENIYDLKYADSEYYWGKEPSAFCMKAVELFTSKPGIRSRLIDLGCGEGRNAIYFARCGYDVVGMDASVTGLEKTRRLALEAGVSVETVQADIISYVPQGTFDAFFSSGALHYLPPEVREEKFRQYKEATSPDGINAMSVFVKKPFIASAPDGEPSAHSYRSGELMGYYWDWEVIYSVEEIFDCMSSGVPHKHAVNRVIARKR
jgi:tellurite methyltransferase